MTRQQSSTTTSGRNRAGDLLVSIGHQPGAVDKLTVVVLKARNIPSNSDVTNGCVAYPITGASRLSILRYNEDSIQARSQRGPAGAAPKIIKCSNFNLDSI